MVRIKPNVDGFNDREVQGFSGGYNGPPPPAGVYDGILTRMGLAQIASGNDQGAQRIPIIVEIASGKYQGAGIFHNFNLTNQGKARFNLFLDSLTDGTQKQKDLLQKWFWKWENGWDLEDEPLGKLGQQFRTIGKNFKPIGRKVKIVTQMGHNQYDEPRAEIAGFIIPGSADSETDVSEEDSDALGEFASETTHNPPPSENGAGQDDSELAAVSSGAIDLDDDDDDPWS